MGYESMSDYQINKLVSELVSFGDLNLFFNDESNLVYLCEQDGLASLNPVFCFDPCKTPSDAWPIILENKISIEFRDHKSLKPVAKRFGSNSHNIAHKNPLRAAMIVFLMMNE